mgnify:FL=1|jgi:hypothetical protein
MSLVIDAALSHQIESKENIDDSRGEYEPKTIQQIRNTSVTGFQSALK